MPGQNLYQLSIKEASQKIKNNEISVVELVGSVLDRAEAVNPRVNAFIRILKDESLQAAEGLDREISTGRYRGPLHGIPISLKDIIDVKGVATTAASKILLENIVKKDAEVVRKLREAGAVIIGKNNLHEWAYAPTNEESYFGPCRNPWDLKFIPGGSSGGSAAAVAAMAAQGALGSDTGGSTRLPASFCGVVGLKPTFGTISNSGMFPVSWSMDHVGIIARTVEDAAFIFDAIRIKNPKEETGGVPSAKTSSTKSIQGLKAAVLKEYFEDCFNPEVRKTVEAGVKSLEKMGVQVEQLSIPSLKQAPAVVLMLMACEVTTTHEKWLRTRPDDYPPIIKTRLQAGYFYLASHYIKAQKLREWFKREFGKAFKKVDMVISPTSPTTAFEVGQKTVDVRGVQTDPRPLIANFTRVHNLTGFPAISVPCGFSSDGLPIGIQIVAKPYDEKLLFRVASAYEQAHDWKDAHPKL